MTDNTPLTLAAITGAHGVRGDVRLKLLGEGLEALKAHSSFNEGTLTLKSVRSDNKGGAIARFAEVQGREQAEKLRGTTLTVPREALPPLEEGEYYFADLIGLDAVTDAGKRVGKVIDVHNYGATDIVEIAKDPVPEKGMKTFMVPMTTHAVVEWNGERIVIATDFAHPD
ncbi:ribosome maturation factor RimM [Erythrobacter litoralis]|uniref:Ribosome maturation factor RimM n=1 Tax=Erythrobacter litoralis (strain HTCC2594) TaxID=314225 RepID=RIMM_ERYLH|nr:ribosome maturation factor RimM [Erythrobacter litoralis]Q2N9Q5.1 RecName: Full=Ribosome maturation factor RimM [Erythrobacter litoralis HTCC2594]ABC63586.1 16S rRNA processing protein [Erythrobacter litoralis HTCC2594]